MKVESEAGAAESVTCTPCVKLAAHVVPQLIPVGELVTDPLPVPFFVTVSCLGVLVKVAVTDLAVHIVTVQSAVPVQPPPLHPVNTEPLAGAP